MNSESVAVESGSSREGRRRRLLPVSLLVGVAMIAASMMLVGRAQAVDLPPEKADTLLASVINSLRGEPSLAGDAVATVDLGLPQLPRNLTPAGDPFSGRHTFRVAHSPDGVRAAELLADGERTVVMNANSHDIWTWDSRTVSAKHYKGSAEQHAMHHGARGHSDAADRSLADPLELARKSLAEVTATTDVSVRPPVKVAGRDSYVLAIEPKTDATLVGSIEIAVDADSRLPLRVEIYGRGQAKPAISVGFTSVHLGPVDPATFDFTPPPGANVTEEVIGEKHDAATHEAKHDAATHEAKHDADDFRTIGEGWTAVTAINITPPEQRREQRREQREFERLFPYSGPLVSAIKVEKDGATWILIGAVPTSTLEGAAAQL